MPFLNGKDIPLAPTREILSACVRNYDFLTYACAKIIISPVNISPKCMKFFTGIS